MISFPYPALFFISLCTLAYELILMRLFSIVQWYHFAYMVISVSLLGFAASGTLLAALNIRKGRQSQRNMFGLYFLLISFLMLLFIPITFFIAQKIPFSPFELAWQKKQFLYLCGYYFLFLIPFFLAGCFVGLSFIYCKENVARVYCCNMIGSSAGVLVAFISFYWIPPKMLLFVPMLLSFCALLCCFSREGGGGRSVYAVVAATGAVFLSIWIMWGGISLNISPYKGISHCLQLPGARLEYEGYSPLGLLQVVSSPSLRDAPGLSLKYTKSTPTQKALFMDGNANGVVTEFNNDRSSLEYLDYATFSLGYHLVFPGRVLILKPEGETQILGSYFHGYDQIKAIESHRDILSLLKGPLNSFTQNIYNNNQHIQVEASSPREYLAGQNSRYDIIQLGLTGSLGGGGGGIYATEENYVYTIEAFQEYFKHLNPDGILTASAWLNNPPRSFLKLITLAIETLEREVQTEIGLSFAAIRSWGTGTVVLKRGIFSPEDISKIRIFCEKRGFDPVYFSGIHPKEVNKYNILERPLYYDSSIHLLDQDTREQFYAGYIFNVRPPTDDKPYFSHYFKLSAISYLLKTLGRDWIPFLEWGYIILWGTLVQVLVFAPIFIFLPLFFIKKGSKPRMLMKGRNFVFFSLLGLAFMFLEMAFVQRFIFLLNHPIYALALIIFTLTLFSGIGSLSSQSLGKKGVYLPFTAIMVLICFYIFCLDPLLKTLLNCTVIWKSLSAVFLLAPLAFFMGMPFPLGLQVVSNRNSEYIPWIWGINGLASVVAPVLGSLLIVNIGFYPLMFVSLALYLFAFLFFYSIFPKCPQRDQDKIPL